MTSLPFSMLKGFKNSKVIDVLILNNALCCLTSDVSASDSSPLFVSLSIPFFFSLFTRACILMLYFPGPVFNACILPHTFSN